MMEMERLTLTGALVLTLAAFAGGAAELRQEPVFRLGRMAAPAIDGRVGESEWQGACETRHFLGLGGCKAFSGSAAFWFGRDAENFYFAAVCGMHPDGRLLRKAQARKGNTEVLNDDNFEFVWVPDMDAAKPDVFHLMVNANGAYFGEGQRAGGMVAWAPEGMRTASQVVDGLWHFELAMPLSTIGFDRCPEAEHGVRLCKTWKRYKTNWGAVTCFSPFVHGFFSSTACPRVTFDDTAPVVRLAALGGGETDTTYPAELTVVNGPETAEYRVRMTVKPQNSQGLAVEETVKLAAGERKDFRHTGPVLGDEWAAAKIEIVRADGKVCYLRDFDFQPKPPALEWMKGDADANRLDFQFAYFPTPSLVRVQSDISELKERDKVATLRFRVLTKAGEEIVAHEGRPDAKGLLDEEFRIPDLATCTRKSGCGDYVIEMSAPGLKNDTVRREFQRNVFEWEGNQFGKSDVIPKPFEKIVRLFDCSDCSDRSIAGRHDHVKVVMRDHLVDKKTGLWKQVKAAGKDLLARPIALVSGNRTIRTIEQSNNSSLSASAEWDVDGLMDWRLTLKPGHYEPMTLEIPIKAERAKLMHACTDGLRFNYAGEIPAGEGRVWDGTKAPRNAIIGDYVPYVWVGGPLRGIAVFGENDKGWVLGDEVKVRGEGDQGKVNNSAVRLTPSPSPFVPCQEILREADGTVTIRLNLVQRAVDLTEERTIRIGFQATPVKPMPEDWRALPVGDLVGCCLYWGGYEDSHAVCPYDERTTFWEKMAETRRTGKVDESYVRDYCANWPSGADPATAVHTQRVKRASAHYWAGMGVMKGCFADPSKETVFYTNGRGVHFGLKPGGTFADEWSRTEFLKRPFDIRSMAAYDLDPVPSFLDYAAWWWEKAFRFGVMDHLYWDDVFCQSNFDTETTDAYRTADGQIQPSSGIFNMRAQIRRGAIVAAECGKKPLGNWIHMTNTAMAPISAFAGVHYDWEDPGSSAPFQERYSRAYMQACTIGRQMGCRVKLMGYFAPTTPERLTWLKRTGVGPTLTHEAGWYRPDEVKRALADFGYGVKGSGVRVWNYWDEDVKFPVEISGVEWSALAMSKRKVEKEGGGGEAMIVVSDWKDGGTVRVKPDCAALGLGASFRAVNAETGAELPVKDGVVEVTLAKYDFAIIRLVAPTAVVNPLPGGQAPDPFVTYDAATGYYYLLHSCCNEDGFTSNELRLRRSRSAARLRADESKVLYVTNAADRIYGNIWAPEMHKAPNGKWYIYTSCRPTPEDGEKRLVVFESKTSDPWDGFVFKGFPAPDLFAIDPTVMTWTDGRQYVCYSQVPKGGGQELAIREMTSPWTFAPKAAVIARAELPWELVPPYDRSPIVEGPFFLRSPDGKRLFVVYSANGCWSDDYCLGVVEHTGGDLVSAASWKKHPKPLFSKGNGVYGPGHASFFRSPDGTETWCAYHTLTESNPAWHPQLRPGNLQKIDFDETGFPVMSAPVPRGVSRPAPSGEAILLFGK